MARGKGSKAGRGGRSRPSAGHSTPCGNMPVVPRSIPIVTSLTSSAEQESVEKTNDVDTIQAPPASATPPLPSKPLSATPSMPSTTVGVEGESSSGHGRRKLITVTTEGLQPSRACSSVIHESFKHELDANAINWKSVSQELKQFYFGEFKKEFHWDPLIDDKVRKAWEFKAGRRYSDFVSKLKRDGAQPKYVQNEVWENWMKLWEDPKCIEKSLQKSKNRCAARVGYAVGTHTGGSITIGEHRKRLAKELGRDPTPTEIHLHVHTYNHDGKSFVGERSKLVHNKIQKLREQRSQIKTSINETQVYYEAVGGEKKRRAYGLGSKGSHYYRPTPRAASGSDAQSAAPVNAQSAAPVNAQQTTTQDMQKMLKDTVIQLLPALKDQLLSALLPALKDHLHQSLFTPLVQPHTTGDDHVGPSVTHPTDASTTPPQ